MNPIYDLLRSDGSIVINKNLAYSIGLDSAIMYSELLSKYYYFAGREQLTEDGYFFNTIENMEVDTSLSGYQQRNAIKNLTKLGLITNIVRGLPAKRYFKIVDDEELIKKYLQSRTESQLSKNCITRSQKTTEVEVKKLHGNNTKPNKTNPNNTKKNIYINLPVDDHVFFNIYGKHFRDRLGKEHMRLTHEQLNDVSGRLNELIEYDVDAERFEEEVESHFNDLPKSNNGNIIAFLKASKRYFEVDTGIY